MFKIGDYMMYSCYGCCQVEDISEMEIDKTIKVYYNLRPYGDSRSVIKTPVDNKKVKMRPVISREEASSLLNAITHLDSCWIKDRNARASAYKELLRHGDTRQLAELVRTLYVKKYETKVEGHKFSAADNNVLKDAEKILYSELGACLDMTEEDIRQIVISKAEEA